jgi:hypothetical protein
MLELVIEQLTLPPPLPELPEEELLLLELLDDDELELLDDELEPPPAT